MKTVVAPPSDLWVPPYKLSTPGIPISWEEMVTRLNEDILVEPKAIEVAVRRKKKGYDKLFTSTLVVIYLKKSKLYMLTDPDIQIRQVHMRECVLPPVILGDSFFFKTSDANYTIYL